MRPCTMPVIVSIHLDVVRLVKVLSQISALLSLAAERGEVDSGIG